jgi:hypothetical protein
VRTVSRNRGRCEALRTAAHSCRQAFGNDSLQILACFASPRIGGRDRSVHRLPPGVGGKYALHTMSTPAVEQMSWEEKLRTLEDLWDVIAREGYRYESPAWREQELKETQQRYDAGAQESMQLRILKSAFGDFDQGRAVLHR